MNDTFWRKKEIYKNIKNIFQKIFHPLLLCNKIRNILIKIRMKYNSDIDVPPWPEKLIISFWDTY